MTTDIRTFTTGAIRDNDSWKTCYNETISWTALRLYAEYMTEKKKKYGEWNFKKGIPDSSYIDSLLRHCQEFMENTFEGWNFEPEQNKLCSMMFNIMWLLHNQGMEEKKKNNN